jgi:hypothetical protein
MNERDAIVAWLRGAADRAISSASYCRKGNAGRSLLRQGRYVRDLALAIERGDHLTTDQEDEG